MLGYNNFLAALKLRLSKLAIERKKSLTLFSTRSWIILIATAIWMTLTSYFVPLTDETNIFMPKEGFSAPDFELDTFTGEKIKLSELKGKPVIVNFWASWCPPCRKEMPVLQTIYEEFNEESIRILAVNVTAQDNERSIEQFIGSNSFNFPVLFDDAGDVADAYRVRALPTTFFIDKNGVITEIVIGGPISEALLRSNIAKIIRGEK